MSEFIDTLRGERALLIQRVAAADAALAAGVSAAQAAKQEWDDYLKNRSNGSNAECSDPLGVRLQEAEWESRNVLVGLETKRKHLAARLAEVERLLTADDQVARARGAAAPILAALQDARAHRRQLADIVIEVRGEIEGQESRRATVALEFGSASVAARLKGKAAPTTKEISTLEADIASRTAALEAAEAAIVQADVDIGTLEQQLQAARSTYRAARACVAERDYYNAIRSVMPALAMLRACGSPIATSWRDPGHYAIPVDEEAVRDAEHALEAELDESAIGA